MPESTDMEDVCRLLNAGINISTTRTEFYNPAGMSASDRASVEKACRAGGSSIHASGSSPGFITEALPIVLTSVMRKLDFLLIDEFANCLGGVVSPEMLTTTMGFGDTPEDFAMRDIANRDQGFEFSLGLVAEAMGVPIDRFEVKTEVAVAKRDVQMGDLTCKAGRVAGQRISVTGFHAGKPLMCFRANWYVSTDLEPAWDLPADSGWKVDIKGDVPLEVRIRFPVTPEERLHAFSGLTAHRPVNAIPALCASPPGVISTIELPRVIARFGPG
jgi:4-hydroxy-tetrahydrodipicolinate reductase